VAQFNDAVGDYVIGLRCPRVSNRQSDHARRDRLQIARAMQ
jgi:hypothetical protein